MINQKSIIAINYEKSISISSIMAHSEMTVIREQCVLSCTESFS
jgi:hypothetical protein